MPTNQNPESLHTCQIDTRQDGAGRSKKPNKGAAIFPVCVCTLLLPGRAGPPQDEHVDGNARAPHRRMRSVRPRLGLPKVVAPCCPPRPARPAYKRKESGGRAEGRGFLQSSGSERRGELPLPILLISLLFPTPHQEERRGGFGRERRRSRRDQLARLAFLPAPSSFSSSSLFWSDLVFFFLLAFNFSGWLHLCLDLPFVLPTQICCLCLITSLGTWGWDSSLDPLIPSPPSLHHFRPFSLLKSILLLLVGSLDFISTLSLCLLFPPLVSFRYCVPGPGHTRTKI